MKSTFRILGNGTMVVALVGFLAGCDDGGRGLQLFFGIHGRGNCSSVAVDVDLDAAGAALKRRGGAADCGLDSLLEKAGCSATFDEHAGGDSLTVTITGCTIAAVSNLFDCGFTDVELAQLSGAAEAHCSCAAAGCAALPPVCADEDPDPRSCEDCDNGVDDDGNGRTDCDDPNCEFASACPPPSTTTTSSTSTTHVPGSTMPSTTTTSTTMPSLPCEIVFALPDDVTVGSLQWNVGYAAAPFAFLGQGGAVECAPLVAGVLAAFNDVDSEKRLEAGVISLAGIEGPTSLAICSVRSPVVPLDTDFAIEVLEASTTDLTPIDPRPGVVVHTIDCDPGDGPSSTTTTTTTSSTVPEPLLDFSALFRLETASTGLGALQFDVDYTAVPGFVGAGASVNCSNLVAGALFAPNDDEVSRRLSLGFIALSPFSAPLNLALCTLRSADVPVEQDFTVTVVDATDPDGVPATAVVSVSVTPKP